MAQNKLLNSLKTIAGKENTVIYTTHSHHLINPLWIENTYIISNGDVSRDRAIDHNYDNSRANIKAMKYNTFVGKYPNRQHYFQPILDKLQIKPLPIEARTGGVLVEGKSDFHILNWFRTHYKPALEINFYPVEGSSNAQALISLNLGLGNDFVVLLDSDKAGNMAKRKYLDQLPIDEDRIIQIGDVLDGKKKIEDLISESVKQKIRQIYGSNKRDKSLIWLAFSQDLSGEKDFDLDDETCGNLEKLTNSISERLSRFST